MILRRISRYLIAIFLMLSCQLIFCPKNVLADPLDNWHLRNIPSSTYLNGIAYGNGVFVAVGDYGRILTSTDGVEWINMSSNSITENSLNGITYGNGLFVAVGDHGTIITSSDGVDWTFRASRTTDQLQGVAYGDGLFVAGGYWEGAVVTSTDGIIWNLTAMIPISFTSNFNGITYGNNKFVITYLGKVLISTNGISWTEIITQTNFFPYVLYDVVYGNNMFVAVGDYGTILTSPDALTWTTQNSGTDKWLKGITYDEGTFVAVGQSGTILTSTDAINWIIRPSKVTWTLSGVGYGNGTFIAVGIATLLQSDPITTPIPPIPQTFMLTISKSGTGNGMVKSSDGKIDCGTDCSEVYNSGSVVTLTPTPDANSIFAGWGGNCVGTWSCSITVNADMTITTNFTLSSSLPQQHTLTVTKTGTGSGTITGTGLSFSGNTYTGEYASGTVVTLTAKADNGSTFDGWSGGGCTGKEACTITLNENTSITASFSPQGIQGTPKISVSPVLANLGSVRVGSASNPKTVIIKNTGTSDLTINSITITGTNASEFNQTSDCTTAIPKGSSCTVNVTLAPALPFGSKNAIMSISSNDPKKPTVNVKCLGKAPPPVIAVSPMSVNLGSIPVDSTSLPKIITVKNTGTSDLVVNSITITGVNASEFSQTSDCTTVPKGSSCPVTVTLAPTISFGKKNAVMSIASNDPKKPTVNVKLSGQAPPPKISASPMSVNLGSIPVGGTSLPKIITVKNTGTSDLVVNSITITGVNASEFIQTSDCTTVPKGSSCAIAVTLSPAVIGSKSAIMGISSNDPTKSSVNVKLTAKGT